jgi:ribonuclease HII
MELPTFFLEQREAKKCLAAVGVDEAGRGPLAGPVVAAAALYKDTSFFVPVEQEKEFSFIRDSKKLSEKKRELMYEFICEHFYVGVGIVSPETIDRVNILEATFLAMKAAITDVKRKLPKEMQNNLYILIDGNQKLPNFSGEQEAIVKGDGKVRSIAAASIIAKVTRDRIIIGYDQVYPGYGFAAHKGYGTQQHMEALQRFGPTPVHRQSFKPVQLASPEAVNKKFSKILKPKR